MRNSLLVAAAVALAPIAASPAFAEDPAPAATPTPAVYTTSATDLGTLLDNPAAKAVLMQYIPTLVSSPQIDMARRMTLKQLQSYAADQLPDSTLAQIDVGLAKVPVAK